MPLFVSLPLPGPFRYSRQIGGRPGTGRGSRLLFWALVGWWAVPMWLLGKWTVIGLVWLVRWAFRAWSTRR